ncbi:serine/threonine protein phosphatase [Siphonobacter sp. BAB-5405]|nr:serine/threonine protein phosphatase [Siphonobacter sp. BAB-5405]
MLLKRLVLLLLLPWTVGAQVPVLSDPNSWSMILLPDPQNYVKFSQNQPILDLMTSWIKENAARLNTRLVLCTGDLVDQNLNAHPDGTHGNQTSTQQWQAVSRSFEKLDRTLPYILATGNHDYGMKNSENRYSQFNSYFPAERNVQTAALLLEMAPNESGVPTLENACYEFTPPVGPKLLIFSLEFLPRTEIVAWAKKLASQVRFANHRGVVLTHSFLRSMLKKNERIDTEPYPLSRPTYGQQLWEKLLAPSRNLQFLICGHVADSEGHEGHVGYREDPNAAGKKVAQMLFNAQREGGGWHGNGGDGWLRILEFLPDGKTIQVRTFSPLLAASPLTRHLAWRTESFDSFRIAF